MKVDMSSGAVTLRLKRVSQLRRLCLDLGKARVVPSKGARRTPQEQTESLPSVPDEVIPPQGRSSDR